MRKGKILHILIWGSLLLIAIYMAYAGNFFEKKPAKKKPVTICGK